MVDTCGSLAFGLLRIGKQSEAAEAVLHNEVLPFSDNLDLPVVKIVQRFVRQEDQEDA